MNKHSITRNVRRPALVLASWQSPRAAAPWPPRRRATATGTVVTPIAITKAADLSFGNFAAGATGGTVTLSPNGAAPSPAAWPLPAAPPRRPSST